MIAIICTDGQMEITDIRKECKSQRWIPIFVYRTAQEIVVPLFSDDYVAKSFIKRNFPPNWVRGGIILSNEDVAWIKSKGWKIRQMSYPNKLTGLKDIEMSFEIIQLADEPDFKTSRF
jgi:hypothetical protein